MVIAEMTARVDPQLLPSADCIAQPSHHLASDSHVTSGRGFQSLGRPLGSAKCCRRRMTMQKSLAQGHERFDLRSRLASARLRMQAIP